MAEQTQADQEQGEGEHANHKSDQNPAEKSIPRRHKFRLAWEFWSEHAASILLLTYGAVFVSPITEFMSIKTKVWSIGFGVLLFCAAIIAFVCKSITSTMDSTGHTSQTQSSSMPTTIPTSTAEKTAPSSDVAEFPKFTDDVHLISIRLGNGDGACKMDWNIGPGLPNYFDALSYQADATGKIIIPALRISVVSGDMYVSLVFVDTKEVFKMDHNHIIQRPFDWTMKTKDGSMEVADGNGIPVFQMVYLSKTMILIRGAFAGGEGNYTFVGDHGMYRPATRGELDADRRTLQPLFSYP